MKPHKKHSDLDFSNTAIAFIQKTNKQLKKTAWIFRLMNNSRWVSLLTRMGEWSIKWNLPGAKTAFRLTIFEQFIGGETLKQCQGVVDKLFEQNVLTVLDYGAEGKSDDTDLEKAMKETLHAIQVASNSISIPVVSTKVTGLVDNIILQKLHSQQKLTEKERAKYDRLRERLDAICRSASERGVGVFIDAEESWLQDPIDNLVLEMMQKYNKSKAIVFNTYQLYNKHKLGHLRRDHQRCLESGVLFGAKLVRGAYMEKERERAAHMGYDCPIQPDKSSTDRDYNAAIQYCVDNVETISSCCASHNELSNQLQAQWVEEKGLPHNHPHINFCQLYGMSDNLTFNLAHAGYNAAKYVVYGPIRDVIPYLIRRSEENTSVTGEMSRELALVEEELHRRGF